MSLRPIQLSDGLRSVFTSGQEFQRAVAQHVSPSLSVLVVSYNLGIHEPTQHLLDSFISRLCLCKEVRLLVGQNPFHPAKLTIERRMSDLVKRHKNLTIRTAEKLHVKAILFPDIGYVGSLNLIHPSLHDLMVKLSLEQHTEVLAYLERLWTAAVPLRIVQ